MAMYDLKSLSLTSNARLAQVGECQTGIAGVLGSISTGSKFFNAFFCFPHVSL